MMGNFVEWLNSPDAAKLHPVEYATEAHSRVVSIHSFRDGNGRVGRLLMNLLLLRSGYPIAVITNERRKQYMDALVYAQERQGDTSRLWDLVADASRESMLEYLRILSTAEDSKDI
jgi:Fic family protein